MALAIVLILATLGPHQLAVAEDPRARRLDALQDEMKRLKGELAGLVVREQSLLGDVERMDADIALRRAELEDISLRLDATEERLADGQKTLAGVLAERDRRARQLAARWRELYKRRSAGLLARVIVPTDDATSLDGLRYAAFLARRDAAQLSAWRQVTSRLSEERTSLADQRARLVALKAEASQKETALTAGRSSRSSLLARVRTDREQHERAYVELEAAARNLSHLVESLEGAPAQPALDVRKFQGLLDWPADGPVSARFGTVVHPRFKTEVPHPGLDIDAGDGQPFRSVFDGRVAYAAPLPGYGLTCVVDHGHGVVSIYAHAAVLLMEAGQEVSRGQQLGKVGESGSLKGPYLYFEMRDAGKPVVLASPALILAR
jgi:septal ring factor EnvC (AmiA/AmiB activator)